MLHLRYPLKSIPICAHRHFCIRFHSGYIPDDFLVRYTGSQSWYAVPVAVLICIPLYSNAAGTIPIVHALDKKGVSIGTAPAYMMAVTALSLPEFLIFKRVMEVRLIAIFERVLSAGILLTCYLFNIVSSWTRIK